MGRFLHDDKMQHASVCCNLKPSCDEMCTYRVQNGHQCFD
jgi:hypothetical protein